MHLIASLFLLFLFTASVHSKTRVHLIPHTHDDVGWLKTIEEYFYGAGKDILGIQYIIEGIMGELMEDSEKKFSWVEMGYFYRYWVHQDSLVQDSIRDLVSTGRLEFLNGGWVMHDEAITYYEDMIDNMALGQKFLKENFGVYPTIGWQIDPFGHSSTNAALFSEMGFDAFWFSRIDHDEKSKRKREKNTEFVWQPRTSQFEENQILAILNYDHYDFPDEFCFDYNCGHRQPPVIDDKSVPGYNIEKVATHFAVYAKQVSFSNYEHDQIIFPMGGDFAYEIASMPFENFDKIKNYINARSDEFDLEVTYSTPSDYVEDLYADKPNFTINHADFFPYSDKTSCYWTGYYSSRNYLKKLVRQAGKDLQNVRRLLTYSFWRGEDFDQAELNSIWGALSLLERKQAELQHHDAVTGTSQQHVADDYYRVLNTARTTVHKDVTSLLFEKELNKLIEPNLDVSFSICEINVVSSPDCDTDVLSTGRSVLVGVFNPVEGMSKVISIPVPHGYLTVTSLAGIDIKAEVICIDLEGLGCTLYFRDDFEGRATKYYFLVPRSKTIEIQPEDPFLVNTTSLDIQITDTQTLTINTSLSDYKLNINGEVTSWGVELRSYTPSVARGLLSGAYVFIPNEKNHSTVPIFAWPTHRDVYVGEIVTQIITKWEDKAVTRISVFDDLSNVQIDTLITDKAINNGKEIVMTITTDIQNNQTFYTDSNGMEMQKRKLNYRENWNWTADERISGNYYPITSSIYIEDAQTQKRATLLVDRAVGGSSLEEGQLEIMLDRRHLLDDQRGLGETLNEAFVPHWHSSNLLITTPNSQKGHYYRHLQYLLDQPSLILAAPVPKNTKIDFKSGGLTTTLDLPEDTKLLIWPQSQTEFIVRFHNMADDKNVTVDLTQFLSSQFMLTETTVTGNQDKESMLKNKKDWTYRRASWDSALNKDYIQNQSILLRSQEIRTFRMVTEDVVAAPAEFIALETKTKPSINKKQKKPLNVLKA